jgi:hypothetical protein
MFAGSQMPLYVEDKTQFKYCAYVISVGSVYISNTSVRQWCVLVPRLLTLAQCMHIFYLFRCIWIYMSLAKSPNARRVRKTYVHGKLSLFYVTAVSLVNYNSVFYSVLFCTTCIVCNNCNGKSRRNLHWYNDNMGE